MSEFMKSLSFVLRTLALSILCSAISTSAQIQQAWVSKYNNGIPNGNHQALKMSLDSSGNIYVLGVSANANAKTGYVVVKYAPNGNQLWTSRYDSTNFTTATPTGFALDSSNAVVVIGSAVTVKYGLNGNLLWTAPYNAQAVAIDAVQNIYLTGVASNFTTAKLNAVGSNLWTQTHIFSPGLSISQMIIIDSSTNVYVAGGENLFVSPGSYGRLGLIKYDKDGTQLWADDQAVDIDRNVQVVGSALDKFGNVYLEYNATLGGNSQFETTKFYSDGSMAWLSFNATDDSSSLASNMVIDHSGNVVATGGNDDNYPNNVWDV